MCNKLHSYSKPIPTRGTGWKLFRIINKKLFPLCGSHYQNTSPDRTSVDFFVHEGKSFGFCFFLTKKHDFELIKCRTWGSIRRPDIVLRKIHYSCGLGKHIETKFLIGERIEIALCRSFRLSKSAIRRGERLG